MKILQILIYFLLLFGLVFGDSDESDDPLLQSDESDDDEKIVVCDNGAEDSICKCENETLKCIHELVDGEILDTTYLKIKQENFLLKSVQIRDNGITILKKGYILPENVKTIVDLYFSDNHISHIEDEAFDDFEVLEELGFYGNKLKTIDKKVFTKKLGSTLLRLNLYKNEIEDLTSYSFKYLTELRFLDLSSNKKLDVDSGIFEKSLSKLETLNMKWCDIVTSDDDAFVNLKKLQKLDLQGNPLTTIPMAVINIPQLMELDLSSTKISVINTDAFPSNHNLSTLKLQYMDKLFAIDDCAFCGLSNLEKLMLASNKHLHDIDENAFGAVTGTRKLQKLKYLSLNKCNFATLPETLYDWKTIDLVIHNNPFACDCSLAWLINNPKLYAKTSLPQCKTPPNLNGTYFTSIAGTFCGGKGTSTTNKTKVLWTLSFFVILMVTFIFYKNRKPILRKIYSLRVRQQGYGNFSPVYV